MHGLRCSSLRAPNWIDDVPKISLPLDNAGVPGWYVRHKPRFGKIFDPNGGLKNALIIFVTSGVLPRLAIDGILCRRRLTVAPRAQCITSAPVRWAPLDVGR